MGQLVTPILFLALLSLALVSGPQPGQCRPADDDLKRVERSPQPSQPWMAYARNKDAAARGDQVGPQQQGRDQVAAGKQQAPSPQQRSNSRFLIDPIVQGNRKPAVSATAGGLANNVSPKLSASIPAEVAPRRLLHPSQQQQQVMRGRLAADRMADDIEPPPQPLTSSIYPAYKFVGDQQPSSQAPGRELQFVPRPRGPATPNKRPSTYAPGGAHLNDKWIPRPSGSVSLMARDPTNRGAAAINARRPNKVEHSPLAVLADKWVPGPWGAIGLPRERYSQTRVA